jgi:hypothetical protein
MSDIKSQTEAVMQHNQILMAMVVSQGEMQLEQNAVKAKNDERFKRMLKAFEQHSTRNPTQATETNTTKNSTKLPHRPRHQTREADQDPCKKTPGRSSTTDNQQCPMDIMEAAPDSAKNNERNQRIETAKEHIELEQLYGTEPDGRRRSETSNPDTDSDFLDWASTNHDDDTNSATRFNSDA